MNILVSTKRSVTVRLSQLGGERFWTTKADAFKCDSVCDAWPNDKSVSVHVVAVYCNEKDGSTALLSKEGTGFDLVLASDNIDARQTL